MKFPGTARAIALAFECALTGIEMTGVRTLPEVSESAYG
jgi:hypothetical protein